MNNIFCTNCGTQCNTEFNFCAKCGTKLVKVNNNIVDESVSPIAIDKSETNEIIEPENINLDDVIKDILVRNNYSKIDSITEFRKQYKFSISEAKAAIDRVYAQIPKEEVKGSLFFPYSTSIEYYGNHPRFGKTCTMALSVDSNKITFGHLFKKESINIKDITMVAIQNERQIKERYTATRIALLGVFALAFKKKKTVDSKYLLIEYNGGTLMFDGESRGARKIADKLHQLINR